MATAKMKIILPLVVWICLHVTTVQSYQGIGFGIKQERFLLNLEDGYFGCQMNTSTDVIQLFELSRLCDGTPDCFFGSDELRNELKCTNDCRKEDGTECQNGVCLDNTCHCNDGFGGCSCEVPDENECKYRPCSPFAHCTNTLGSFFCTCFSGYQGDGLHCEDINECDDPAIAARCVENAECCNLPSHFLCKCKPGFQGDGESRCIDIDECALPNTCGHNALCLNTPGNYTCVCPPGFQGNPYDGCVNSNDCESINACGPGAICTRLPGGGKSCDCPPGFEGDAYSSGCYDADECSRTPCGRDAICTNLEGSYRCVCPPGFVGDPSVGCTDIACHAHEECQTHLACIAGVCQNPCAVSNPCGHQECQVQHHQPVCVKVCQCQRNEDCGAWGGFVCDGCNCVQYDVPAITTGCEHCPPGIPCDPTTGACIKVGCTSNEHCPLTEACINGACQRPCDLKDPCAQNAVCINTNHGQDCSCAEGYQGNGYVGCVPVIDYKPICQYNEDCPPNKLCDRLSRICINPCFEDSCGDNAECIPKNHGIDCQCLPGHAGNPYVFCTLVQGCQSDHECSTNLACINGQCSSPCRCGPNAICDVINHKPFCKCPAGYNGNPQTGCSPPLNPCEPNPCGIHAFCELDNGNPICFCPKGFTGNPFQNCIPEGDECTPNPCGPNSGCRLVGGKAVCFCLPEFEGSPPTIQCSLPANPCNPSPCGPNTQCTILSNGFAKCTCLTGYLESPNTIRGCVEQRNPCEPNPCGHGAQCDPHREPVCFCSYGLIGNPYRSCEEPVHAPALCQPGPCGYNADCYVSNNEEQCYCKPGFIGDAYVGCRPEPTNPCVPNPCSHGAICLLIDQHPICQCPEGMGGDPTGPAGCHGFECLIDDDCSAHQACIGHRCRDPCPGCCGVHANCRVEQHHPVCTCDPGFTGNPLIRCYLLPEIMPPNNPCMPNPCGLNTICQAIKGRAVCSCLPDFLGDPQIGCQPECTLNSDCPQDKSCINRHCINPCKIGNLCGVNAVCQVEYHAATCICPEGYTGDAFIQCIPKPTIVYPIANVSKPCYPSPCDQHYHCDNYGGHVAICDPCLGPNAIYHPQCRPECLTDADCPFNRACLGEICSDPCIGSCGVGAICMVVAHTPVCSCPTGLFGNPFEHCSPPQHEERLETCENVQCGSNAYCKQISNALACICKPGFFGNPWIACRPECVINTDCAMRKACLNNRCVDPCAGACGLNAQCEVVNHIPVCFCPVEHTGDPFVSCFPFKAPPPPPIASLPANPCDPSPCGPFSRCLVSPQGYATCSCLPSFRGTPPACKPECVVSSECSQNKACMNQKCVDPCPGTCGIDAHCAVINHNPICTCPIGQRGDPFVNCYSPVVIEEPKTPGNPCVQSPCGPNSICQVKENRPVCSCVANYIGSPPYCRPECVINQECPRDKACIREKCVDPCIGNCGHNARCSVVNHTPFCTCVQGYEGDAFIGCSKIIVEIPRDPCNPSPCGENSQCNVNNGVARCTCIPPYIGNPYAGGCRPECTINSDCATHLACLAQHCRDPCQGLCGINAECNVVNHVPVCSCPRGLIGDPFTTCRQEPIREPVNPCDPSPCGPHSTCRINKGHAVCSCQAEYIGAPPNCRPECLVNSECNLNKACINQKCQDPCPGTCGISARCQVINHNPICSCPPHYVGDPFVRCQKEEPLPIVPISPCVPSPCGPNAECRVVDTRPVCSCLIGMFGAPPNCRPECVIHQDCPSHLACINNKCKDPCVGSCGFNAQCLVQNHHPQCVCLSGYEGDPFVGCNQLPVVHIVEEPRHPCNPSPCGSNAACTERNGAGSCVCLPQYFGDPYSGCRPECVMNSDCPHDRSCINNKCRDPCPGTCGLNAECRVAHHSPVCTCLEGFTGSPSTSCHPIPPPPIIVHEPVNPCVPTPCGPYSICRVVNEHAVCSCQKDYVGTPPTCRPECVISADCPQDKACIRNKCQDPCPGTCGLNARCQVTNHNPICSCPPGLTGDPFVRCLEQPRPIIRDPVGNPCQPSPCGPNSQCKVINEQAVCSCLPNYVGRAPNCRPECSINPECPGNLACLNEKCRDPCPGSCGLNTNCIVLNHSPICQCNAGFTGDPFVGCSPVPIVQPVEEVRNPCNPSPCGANAICKERNGAGSCTCLPEYFGDPYTACQPECVINTDCPRDKACVNMKCKDPCPGTCGINAECRVNNHAPSCYCYEGFIGNPTVSCHQPPAIIHEEPKRDPCIPSPCGPYSVCRVINEHAVCSCQANYIGTPPMCKPECMISADCPLDKACVNTKCQDPCPGTCGFNARCHVVNHNPICSCNVGYTGDPFVRCILEEKRPIIEEPINPCQPSPCGPNSVCRAIGNTPACSCKPNYVGRPPNCRPECTISAECPSNLACINEKCIDPCPGSCGANAECHVINHKSVCMCRIGYTGDPFGGCSLIPVAQPVEEPSHPCNPSPCGANAICKERNGVGSCICIDEYFGDPYTGCRPECVTNSDCPRHKACIHNKCRDPCPGVCGLNAECHVSNHAPSCNCLPGYIGNPLSSCHLPAPVIHEEPKGDPCVPSPCGPYSQCRVVNGHAVCSCQKNYVGSPPACKPECVVSAECPQDKACINNKCQDPCPGTCGLNARCLVTNHNPICSCPLGFVGDPFVKCFQEEKRPVIQPSGNPCVPSPCGPNSQCRVVGEHAACSCLPNYIGRSPNCRPECTINAECPGNLACQNERCVDPCPGSCGSFATCRVIKHAPVCMCEIGYTGDPFSGCRPVPPTPQVVETPRDPCNPTPCGANAICKEHNGAGSCICLPEYFGDPYTGCRPECVTNSDCDRSKSCINNKCKDPCPGTCGINAECHVFNHAPSCSCIPGYTGNPTTSCTLILAIEEVPVNPCQPTPCGPYSQCRELNGHAVCSCNQGYIGAPPMCRPECVVSSECPQNKACVNQKCIDPCPGTCGLNAKCQVINHNPICSCPPGHTGDPFVRCTRIELPPPPKDIVNPCVPSPCGPNSQCRVVGEQAACSCLPNYIGRPPSCRPECTTNSDCPNNLACRNEKCTNPCSGSCGQNAICTVVNHNAICSCLPGFIGNALVACNLPPPPPSTERSPPATPCFPSPCGPNALCRESNGAGACICPPNYLGDPYEKTRGCHRECETSNDCKPQLACVAFKCVDPCPGTCGSFAECQVSNHVPTCVCLAGYTGDPFFQCREIPVTPPPRAEDPCLPSPCGPNSQCRNVNGHSVCSCLPNYSGSPPNCRPECIVSSECPLDKACINQKCGDPCPNTCGIGAQCYTKNHNPICACPPGFTGNPFTRCTPQPVDIEPTTTERPPSCHPSPCGPNSQCQIRNGAPSCSCLPNYLGAPPNCRPECVINSECSSQLACINLKCKDPCIGSCGSNAKCHVLNHVPICTCEAGHTGDPFIQCTPTPPPPVRLPDDPCNPSPCGPNAHCNNGVCTCLPEYLGNPYESCRPECVLNNECSRDKACLRNKCKDPCPGTCGQNARCDVINHIPTCSCIDGYTGDPFTHCRIQEAPKPEAKRDPCNPSPCGPNSKCINVNDHAVCSCIQGYIGSPPNCKPECVVSAECSPTKACVNKKCLDPCLGSCGLGARCEVINHSPICSCPEGQTGDPFQSCRDLPKLPPQAVEVERDPCLPTPCGPNSICRNVGNAPSCTCIAGYVGQPPNCRPECVINPDCPSNQACINNKCKDPCPGSCGTNAECRVISHAVSCYCSPGFTGNPFVQCVVQQQEVLNPCEPSPCGANAICKEQNGAGSCTCLPDYQGNPYEGCRPECVLSADCPTNKACVRNKCQDPCLGVCGQNAECNVINHVPTCTCITGYIGNPFTSCTPQPPPQPITEATVVDACNPSPCGPNSQCRNVNDHAVCSCLTEYIGTPPNCRPECVVSSECPQDKACHKFKCANPCKGTCGVGARCEVINHNPICSCPQGLTGDPFTRCYELPPPPPIAVRPARDPCIPSPCGPNSICRAVGDQPSCSCLANYVGSPPNCRPECVVNTECASNLACIAEKCRDPCPGSCGFNAECRVQNHIPICTCLADFVGDPFVQCNPKPPPPPIKHDDPCSHSPCGANAQCNNGLCTCLPQYHGDPNRGCRPECTMNTDCSPNKSCKNLRCINPCPGTCGDNAKCDVVNHIPTCSCPPGYEGDPFTSCRLIVVVQKPKEPCNPSPCGPNSVCKVINSVAVCSCQSNYIGSPPTCRPECIVSAECPLTQACLNNKCVDPCPGTCGVNARCQVTNHNPICSCNAGHTGDPFTRCYPIIVEQPRPADNPCVPSPCGPNSVCQVRGDSPACSCVVNFIGAPPNCRPECTINSECTSDRACIRQKCSDPCPGSCGSNALCKVINHNPVCTCYPGYSGDPFTGCVHVPVAVCRTDKGYISTPDGSCECPPNTALNENDECVLCPIEKGLKIDERGRCVCALERGLNIDERGNCVCPVEFGYRLDSRGNCVPVTTKECEHDDHCPDHKYCNLLRNVCEDPCPVKNCGINALCNATNHQAICQCIAGYTGDPEILCNRTSPFRTDFPRPEMVVSCLSDGVQVEIHITEPGFNGVLYVKGHSKDEQCRRVVTLPSDTLNRIEYFKVQFGNCGLIHVNGQASFVLVIQKHPKLVTYKAQAYHIKCVYQTGEQNVTLGFNVSMLTTAGTIANTGPPPTCIMKIVTPTGQEINSAEIGDNLMLQVDVQPGSIYGGFARSCVAKTMEDNIENEYLVTDENGCATDPTIFGEWEYNSDTQSLLASFNAFKFPSSDNIRFQCNIRVCFGKCQPVNCRGYNAFGRRKRQVDDENNTDLATSGDLMSGQLREEITIQSNAILTFERREERFTDPQEAPDAQRVEDICVSMIGFIISLIITALLALVAVAVAVSCWLMAYRRRPKATGPLPHPPEFPNPLFTTPEPMAEPSPDYLT